MNSSSIITNILNSNDPVYLQSLITDDLFSNYRLYIKDSYVNTSYDYTTLSTKSAYDSFTNTSNTITASNIETETIRKKSVITYAKQYILVDGLKQYSYRIITNEEPIIVTANATATSSPSAFISDVQTVEQTFTLNILKTITVQKYVAGVKSDLISMPSLFANSRNLVTVNSSDTYFAVKTMLINYYSLDLDVGLNMSSMTLIGLSFVIGLAALMYRFNWPAFSIFLTTTMVPIIVAFLDKPDTVQINELSINYQQQLNRYYLLSGFVGVIIGITRFLYNATK